MVLTIAPVELLIVVATVFGDSGSIADAIVSSVVGLMVVTILPGVVGLMVETIV